MVEISVNTVITSGMMNNRLRPISMHTPENNKLYSGTLSADSLAKMAGALHRSARPNSIRQPE
ncbi:hypothetical protein D3C85_1451750 [compost metagenome]